MIAIMMELESATGDELAGIPRYSFFIPFFSFKFRNQDLEKS